MFYTLAVAAGELWPLSWSGWTAEGAGMLRELRVSEMRYRAVCVH
ncbi:hypothetical protein I545_6651 [Mycobacterium kansasii 662]|uniref:Uncharacterized protein n=2 Tax=Mycobacterium kansasii TaxID=1768 RepID=A0A1V3WT42_MYCKA|nr:hypothetical protein I545_6677 [Mycobacterium kansasii 662]EUA03477.1 hypothetical protein I547_2079 [Mycobacterium kansasii 824]KEP44468.1 hypothetical protein MKSMC1_04400 [Mycobacterium kansasii]EUA02449.1 hypothetical protein I545_6651 [Mycobacterium kansasii 662]OOK68942.1 hypothetical protein BZL30_7013 [Mycobacterium kansasii]